MRITIWAALLICAASASPAHPEDSATIPVGTVTDEKRPVAKPRYFVRRDEAINRVEVRARVKGYLEAVLFKEGDMVKEGAPLYRIEKGLFEAEVEQAKGALQTSKAQHELAIKARKRQDELFEIGRAHV